MRVSMSSREEHPQMRGQELGEECCMGSNLYLT